jgi:peptide/nickel transport system permease protein
MLASSPSTITETELQLEHPEPSKERGRWRRPRGQRLGIGAWLAIAWLVVIVLLAIFVPMLYKSDPIDNLAAGNSSKGFLEVAGHPFGFDRNGNDMFLLLCKGARSSLMVSVGAITFGLLVGGSLGLIAGYFKRGVDGALSTFFNVLLAIPQFVLALSLVTVFATTAIDSSGNQSPPSSGRRMAVLIFALGVVTIPILARITRANTLQWSQREFVMAARAQGATNFRTMVREVLPNVLPAMFSIALLGIAVVIVAEGGLSILGVGVLSPAVSWGSMIATSRADLQTLPYEVLEPIVFIFFTVLSLNFLGDVVRARFDVRESAI